jgi:hypothetical protein
MAGASKTLGMLHRDKREHLQKVILPHIAKRTDWIIERTSLFDADFFEEMNIYAIN